jgi:Ca-activated chloride channel family protein
MIKPLFILFIGLCVMPVSATTVHSYQKNREALKKYDVKSYFPAFKDLLSALEDDPLNPYLHLNLGRALEANEEFDKAAQAYKSALMLVGGDEKLKFQTYFNLGSTLGKGKKIDQALEAYQAALEIDPDSKETKHNIELLTQGGGRGGEGESDDKNQDKDGKEGQQKDQKQKDQGEDQKDKKQKKPKPFESQELTPQDVKKILDEIKNQEQAIRAQEYDKGAKEAPKGKDW